MHVDTAPAVGLHPAGGAGQRATDAGDPVAAGPTAPPRRNVNLLAIAEGFAASAADLPELHGLTERSWILLAATDLFEAWAIVWPAGGAIQLHDHGNSSGAVVVARGQLVETTVKSTAHGVALIETHEIGAGQHRTFGPRYVHDLSNDGDSPAVSVHVYGPRLDTMNYYELGTRGRLRVVRTEEILPPGPFDTTGTHDPS